MIRFLVFSLYLLTSNALQAAPEELVFGSVAMDIPAKMHERLKPMTEYLAHELGIPVRLQLSPNMKAAIEQVARGEVDIAYLTPVAYIDSHAIGNTRILVKTMTPNQEAFHLMISAREDGPVRRVEDLRGRRFAFGDEKALLQRAVVVGAGIDLAELGSYHFIGHYDNIALGVASGDFDAGILKDTTAQAWTKKGLRIIHTSPALPPYNISARHGLDEVTFHKLKTAFLKLSHVRPRDRAVLQALSADYTGFAETTDAEYDVIRDLVKPFR